MSVLKLHWWLCITAFCDNCIICLLMIFGCLMWCYTPEDKVDTTFQANLSNQIIQIGCLSHLLLCGWKKKITPCDLFQTPHRAVVVNDTHLTDPTESPVLVLLHSLNCRCCFITAGTRATPTKVNKQTHLNMCGSQSRHRAPEMEIFQYARLGVCRITSALCAVSRKVNAASWPRPRCTCI